MSDLIKGSFGRGRDEERRRRLEELHLLLPNLLKEEVTRLFSGLHTLAMGPVCAAIRTAIDAVKASPAVELTPQEKMALTIAANPPKPLFIKRYRKEMLAALHKAVAEIYGIDPVVHAETPAQQAGEDFYVRYSKPRVDVLTRTLSWNGNGRAFTVRTNTDRTGKMPDEWQAIADGHLKFLFCCVENNTEDGIAELVLVDLFQLYRQSSQLKDFIKDRCNKIDDSQFISCLIEKMPESVVIWRKFF